MRYREVQQAVFSCARHLGGEFRFERPPMLGDAVDGEQQFVHAGEQRDLGPFAACEQVLVIGAQPRVRR